ncbi:NTP transferase domain-containing protein [Paenibacillus sp. P26]|nr:NTP transferase domain-containing protein [Paenibacillus sp. P26]
MNKESAKLTGVILAGGQNRRMNGRSKAPLTIGGQTFLSRQLSEMSRVCSELLLIAPDRTPFERELEPYGERVRIEADLHPGLGPLAGLETAMTMALGEVLWVVGCDMPFLSADAAVALEELRRQERTELAVPRLGRSFTRFTACIIGAVCRYCSLC